MAKAVGMLTNSAMLTNQRHRGWKSESHHFCSSTPRRHSTWLCWSWTLMVDGTRPDCRSDPRAWQRRAREQNESPGCAAVDVKKKTKNLECWQGCSGKEGVDLPRRPRHRPDTVFSPKSHRRGVFLCAVGVRLRVRGCLDCKLPALPPHRRGGTRSGRGVSLDQLVRVGSAGDAAPG